MWVKDNVVIGVKPRPELQPFFQMNYEEFMRQNRSLEDATLTRVELGEKHGELMLAAA